MKRTVSAFIAGFLLASLFSLIQDYKNVSDEKQECQNYSDIFGVDCYYGESARKSAEAVGIIVPPCATDCFYAIGGLKPVIDFIAFTPPRGKLWETVKIITSQERDVFQRKSVFQFSDFLYGPESFSENYRSLLFNVSSSDILTCNFILHKSLFSICAVDETAQRIFIIIRSDD
jgi:hypothetical protein